MTIPNEHGEQAAVVEWAERRAGVYPELRRLFAIPNGGPRLRGEAGRKVAEGLRPGVPDLFLPVASGEWHGLFVEMKRLDGKVSKEQEDWIDYLRYAGYCAEVCYGAAEAIVRIEVYLNVPLNLRTRIDGQEAGR